MNGVRRFLAAAAALLIAGVGPASALNMTFGDCSAILDLDLGDRAKFLDDLQARYPGQDVGDLVFIVEVAGCGQQGGEAKRLELLLLALDQMLYAKRNVFIPALDSFLAEPNEANFEMMAEMGVVNLRKISAAFDKLVDAELDASSQAAAAQGRGIADAGTGTLQGTRQYLLMQLQSQLQSRAKLTFRSALQMNREAMIVFRARYVEIVEQIAQTVEALRATVKQQLATVAPSGN